MGVGQSNWATYNSNYQRATDYQLRGRNLTYHSPYQWIQDYYAGYETHKTYMDTGQEITQKVKNGDVTITPTVQTLDRFLNSITNK